jgi:RND family efflux transporter MFP subunit
VKRFQPGLFALLALPALAEGPLAPPQLRLVAARPAQATARETVTGQLNPAKVLPLGFEVGGRLAYSRVSRGDVVKAGQLLGNLDTEIIDAQVAQAEAGVLAAEAGATLAADVALRNQTLLAEGSVSDVQSRQLTAQAKAAEAQLGQARAQLAQARAGQRRHVLRALFPAAVIEAPDQVGGLLGPGTPVYVLMSVDTLLLKATIPEGARALVKPGLKVRVEAVGSAATTEEGVVKAVLASADPQTHRVPVEVAVPNADGRFVANTLARALIPLGEGREVVVVPVTALGTSGGGDHLMAVDASGTLHRVPVTVMERQGATVTVAPAQPVTQVVDYPTPGLVEGTRLPQR